MNKINHIAIIMDGNGRWGKKRGKSRKFGHINGVKVIEKIVKNSIKENIPILTFYTFSTENWKRPKTEIKFLFKLIDSYFVKEINNLVKNSIKINIIGDLKKLPKITNLPIFLLASIQDIHSQILLLVNQMSWHLQWRGEQRKAKESPLIHYFYMVALVLAKPI